ncbi:MAG: CDP-glycerol glycerophosphotransferase family protein [Lachnospiraceae bacterium]|nr:CDP-glycerol glycerophosphotransferase family protein [Lachnospiraceae bacterium]
MKFRIKQFFKMICQHTIFPIVYFFNRWKPVEKGFVILADAHHESCPPHMMELRRYLVTNGYKIEEIYFDVKNLGMFQGLKRMIEFMAIYPKAHVVFLCDYFLPASSCKKKKKTKVVQLWHGCGAFKKFGYSSKDDVPLGYKGDVFKNYTEVTVSGKAAVPGFSKAMCLAGRVVPVGASHTDRLFDANYIEQCKDRLRFEYPDSAGKKVVVWAPTFRGNAANATLVGQDAIDMLMYEKDLMKDYYFIKSIHPHIGTSREALSTDELIACADILITDYSSVFFEFLLMDKPIIFMAPDYEEYKLGRGFYLNYEELPGKLVIGRESLPERVKKALKEYEVEDTYIEARDTYKKEYMSSCDGYVTERVVNRYLSK